MNMNWSHLRNIPENVRKKPLQVASSPHPRFVQDFELDGLVWLVKMPTQNLLRLLLLLMLIMRIVLAKVFADLKLRFGHKAKLLFRL